MKTLLALLLLGIAPALAFAADPSAVSGTWQVHLTIGSYDNTIACTFSQKDQLLTGTCDTEGGPSQLNGKVIDKKVSWSYKTSYNGSDITAMYDGVLDSEGKITGNVNVPEMGATGDFTATLSK